VRIPIDVSSRVSPQLSAFMDKLANDPDREEPPTLRDVQAALQRSGGAAQVKLHPQERTTALAEIDAIIRRFGADAVAEHFIRFE
jgi:hypothetical protein